MKVINQRIRKDKPYTLTSLFGMRIKGNVLTTKHTSKTIWKQKQSSFNKAEADRTFLDRLLKNVQF